MMMMINSVSGSITQHTYDDFILFLFFVFVRVALRVLLRQFFFLLTQH